LAKLSELRPGQKVQFSPVHDKSLMLSGELADFAFLAIVKSEDGATYYAHSDDIKVLEQPKPSKLSEVMRQTIADEVQKAIASGQASAAVPEWKETDSEEKK